MTEKIYMSRGNVFEDLGFTREEAAVYAMQVDLSLELERFIKRRKLTQAKAAEFFGVTQPRISKILRGQLDDFTIDYLVKMVSKTGRTPHVLFRKKAKPGTGEARPAARTG